MIYFPETIIQWGTNLFMVVLYNCCTMHKTLTLCITVSWSCGESVSRLSGHAATSLLLHCLEPTAAPFPFLEGRAPVPKMASVSSGSTHTPSPLSVTFIFYFEGYIHTVFDRTCFWLLEELTEYLQAEVSVGYLTLVPTWARLFYTLGERAKPSQNLHSPFIT